MSLVYPRMEAAKIHSEWGHKLGTNNQQRRSKSQVSLGEEMFRESWVTPSAGHF